MSRIVFWTGPVNLAQAGAGATVPGASRLNIPCTGDGSDGGPTCGTRADSWGTLPGTQPGDELFLGAFSAGGSGLKRFLLHPEARAQTRALMLADATYTDWASPGKPLAPEGFVLFGLDALAGDKMFVATCSASPNKNMPNGSQTLESIRLEIERRSGRTFTEVDPSSLGVSPPPVRAWRLGNNILFADYQMTVPHGGQVGIASQYWQNVLTPWLDGVRPGAPAPENIAMLERGVAAVAGVALGFAVGWWFGKRAS